VVPACPSPRTDRPSDSFKPELWAKLPSLGSPFVREATNTAEVLPSQGAPIASARRASTVEQEGLANTAELAPLQRFPRMKEAVLLSKVGRLRRAVRSS